MEDLAPTRYMIETIVWWHTLKSGCKRYLKSAQNEQPSGCAPTFKSAQNEQLSGCNMNTDWKCTLKSIQNEQLSGDIPPQINAKSTTVWQLTPSSQCKMNNCLATYPMKSITPRSQCKISSCLATYPLKSTQNEH